LQGLNIAFAPQLTEAIMNGTFRRSLAAALLAVILLGTSACVSRGGAESPVLSQASRTAITDQVRSVVAESARAYESPECSSGKLSWYPTQPPYVHFAAEDQIITLTTLEEIEAYCRRLTQGRLSTHETIQEQTVQVLTPDVAYVVTQSLQMSQWRDGRTQTLPTVETAIVAREEGAWRIVYKHISWRDSAGREGQ